MLTITVLEQIDWEKEFNDRSGQDCMDIFYQVIQKETDRCIPKKRRRKGNKPLWMNRNIIRLLRKKRRLWKVYSTHSYYQEE